MPRHYTALLSSLFGAFASRQFSSGIQRFINRGYVKLMGLDMSEFSPPESYPSLNALFTRALLKDRPFDTDASALISPCDALVTDCGTIAQMQAYQIKGMAYDTASLLGEHYSDDISRLEGGSYFNLYLSPRDYHRYHIPCDLTILSTTHIPGKLYPVNMPLLRNKRNLFIENERVVLKCRDSAGQTHFVVLVGALNVGKMVVSFEPSITTNTKKRIQPQHYRYETPITVKKGELFGWFEMGSTIVILSEKDAVTYDTEAGQKVSYGQTIGKIAT